MDTDLELARAKWLFFSGIAFIASCFYSYSEFVYLIRGRDTVANVTKVWEEEVKNRYGMTEETRLSIEYSFTEPDGTRRKGSDFTSLDWTPSPNVKVRYTPGAEGRSRFVGHVNWLSLGIFTLTLCVMAGFGYRIWKSYSADYAPRRSRR
ncbi:MAG: hypothetical protein U0798_04025 [Gemmataceae bacterium]